MIDKKQFQTEFECEFLGSINTLISTQKLKTLAYRTPKQSNAGLDIHIPPKESNVYVITADVSRGTANDYSAFVVFDVTEIPYKIVAKFRDNEIKPLLFPTKIHEVAKAYNNAYVMVEVNDIGEQVANTLQFDLEYENLVMASMRGRAGQVLGAGFSGGRARAGARTRAGCWISWRRPTSPRPGRSGRSCTPCSSPWTTRRRARLVSHTSMPGGCAAAARELGVEAPARQTAWR